MSGMNDNIGAMGSWSPTNPSPRTLFSNFLNEDFDSRTFSGFLGGNGNDRPLPPDRYDEQKMLGYAKAEVNGAAGAHSSSDYQLEPNVLGFNQKSSTSGGLAGRMAASGFSLSKLNVSPGLASSDVVTIPAGLSPTTLLDSPIFLSDPMVQPSPTTGKFMCGENNNVNPVPVSLSSKVKDDILESASDTFAFRPPQDSNFSFYTNAERRVVPSVGQQLALPNMTTSLQSGRHIQTGIIEASTMKFQSQQDTNLQAESKEAPDDIVNQKRFESFSGSDHSPSLDDKQDGDADAKGELSSTALGTPAEDEYNWRKYGQKQVKGSEYPRSYYKCTHLNCPVKKKVERSHEGHITEIIYKGAHNHPKPPPNRRCGLPSSHPFNDQQLDGFEQPGVQASLDNKLMWASAQNGSGQNWRGDILEATSTAIAAADAGDPSTSVQQNQEASHLSADGIDVSSTMSNDEVEDDRATHGSASQGCDGEVDETESKRRKLEACAIEMGAVSRAVREPRVVVQTTSEVDILDDGYRWRKYGQKVVKGNPNPRSYYKCTNPGCTVRKHVERASHDLKSVITTYEGKHNHEVPAARNSGHPNSAPSSNTTATSAAQPNSLIRRPEASQDGQARFDGHLPLSAFGFPGREQLGALGGFSFMGQSGFTNFPMGGLGPVASMKMPVLPPVYPFVGHHQPLEGGLAAPKGEPKEEPTAEQRLQIPNGPVYQQMIGRLPLGPQM